MEKERVKFSLSTNVPSCASWQTGVKVPLERSGRIHVNMLNVQPPSLRLSEHSDAL